MHYLKRFLLFAAVCTAGVLWAARVSLDSGTLIVPEPGGGARLDCRARSGEITFPFNPAKPGYAEIVLPRPLPLGIFRSARIAAKVRVPAGSPVRRMSLRLLDRNREVFQYVSQADFARGGEFEGVWQVKPEQFQLCWGGRSSHLISTPKRRPCGNCRATRRFCRCTVSTEMNCSGSAAVRG